jgi:hypothetical protein
MEIFRKFNSISQNLTGFERDFHIGERSERDLNEINLRDGTTSEIRAGNMYSVTHPSGIYGINPVYFPALVESTVTPKG